MPQLDNTDEIEFVKSSSYRLQVYNDLRSQISETLRQLNSQRETYLSIVVDLETRLAAAKNAEQDALEDRFVMESKLELALSELRRNEEQRSLGDEDEDRGSSGKFDDEVSTTIPETSTRYETLTIEFVKLQKSLDDTSTALSTKSSELFQSQNLARSLKKELDETRGAINDKTNLLFQLDEAKRALIDKTSLLTQAEKTISSLNLSLNEMSDQLTSKTTELLALEKHNALLQEQEHEKNIEIALPLVIPQKETLSVCNQTDQIDLADNSTETDDYSSFPMKNSNSLQELNASLNENKKLRQDLDAKDEELKRARNEIERLKEESQSQQLEDDTRRVLETQLEARAVETASKYIQTLDDKEEARVEDVDKCTQTEKVHEDDNDKCTQTVEIITVQTTIATVQTDVDLGLTITTQPVIEIPPPLPSLPPPPPHTLIVAEPAVDEFFYSTPAQPPSQPFASASIPRPVRSRSSSSSHITNPVSIAQSLQKEEFITTTPPKISQSHYILSKLAVPPAQPTAINALRPSRSRAASGFTPAVAETPPTLRQHKVLITSRQSIDDPLSVDWITLQSSSATPTKPGTVQSLSPPSAPNPSNTGLDVNTTATSLIAGVNDATEVSFFIESQVVDTSGTSDSNSTFLYRLSPSSPPKPPSSVQDQSSLGLNLSFGADQEAMPSKTPSKTPLRDIVESLLSGYASLSSISNDAWVTLTQVTPTTSPVTASPEGGVVVAETKINS